MAVFLDVLWVLNAVAILDWVRPAPIPWIRFAAVLLVVSIPVVRFFPYDMAVRGMNFLSDLLGQEVRIPADLALPDSLLNVCAAIFGTLVLLWLSLRLADAKS